MGVHRQVWHWRWPFVMVIATFFLLGIYYSFLGGTSAVMDVILLEFISVPGWIKLSIALVAGYFMAYTTPVFLCPNCEREIAKKS